MQKIRTTDRQTFRRCRRKWALGSPLKMNRSPFQQAGYFWIGTGGHFALEDYHGYNYYGNPVEAFRAFVSAQRKCGAELPDDWFEQAELGEALMEYYLTWLQARDPLETIWIDGVPQVEVRAQVPLPFKGPDGEDIVYDATFDRVVRIDGELWILDYKFYKQFYPINLDYDEQGTSYLWAAAALYDEPVGGIIFQQHKKHLPDSPRILANGKLSTSKQQNTTHRLYKEALEQQYGEVNRAPSDCIQTLNHFANMEGEERDNYIKRDRTRRSMTQLESAGDRILMEVEDMLDPDLKLYPNFTQNCSWDCPFNDICLMMERDEDWEKYLEESTIKQSEQRDTWRQYLPSSPSNLPASTSATGVGIDTQELNININGVTTGRS